MILRVCVVIPAYNNPRTISTVVNDVVKSTPFPILIVDDGSETAVENVLYSFAVRQALETGRVRIKRFKENRGKGAALKFAIQDLVTRGFTHMVTMDGDGKHLGREISKLIKIGKSYPWDLVISNQDRQSGFRLYPLFVLQTMTFWSTGYDFEVEVLIRFMLRGISVRRTEIESRPPEITIEVSRWRKIRHRFRFQMLDALLKVISLLKSQRSPRQLAVGVGVGAFVGCSPFFGFHTLIVAGLALILPLNFVAMWLGTHISTLPLTPFVVIASLVIGKSIPGLNEMQGPYAHFFEWFAGSFVLGTGVGLALGSFTYLACVVYRRRADGRINQRVGRQARRFGKGILKLALRKFGLRAGYACLYPLAAWSWAFSFKAKRALHEFYRLTRPNLSWLSQQRLIFEHFAAFCEMRMDRIYLALKGGGSFPLRQEGLQYIRQARQNENGLILLSLHLGSVNITADIIKLNDFRGQTVMEIHQALKRGDCVQLMIDRGTPDRSELISFLGKLAPFDVTPFALASALQVPVIFCFGIKNDQGGYEFIAREPRAYKLEGSRPYDLQIFEWAKEFVREAETLVKRHPGQWFNLYPYWSAVPTQAPGKPSNNLLEELKVPSGPGPEPAGEPASRSVP